MQETTHFYKVKFFVANSTNFYEVLSFKPAHLIVKFVATCALFLGYNLV